MRRTSFRTYEVDGWRHPLVVVCRGGSNVDATELGMFLEPRTFHEICTSKVT